MIKILLIFIGSLFVGIAFIGVVLPGLPATPFLLVAAGCYVRSSDRLYNWVINHRLFGQLIRDFREKKAMRKKHKIISIVSMWSMIGITCIFSALPIYIKLILILSGMVGSTVLFRIKTISE